MNVRPNILEAREDMLIALSRAEREAEERREELSLDPMSDAPAEGITFSAVLRTEALVIRCERMDGEFVTPSGVLPATYFLGMVPGSESSTEDARRRRDEINEDYDNDRQAGREEY